MKIEIMHLRRFSQRMGAAMRRRNQLLLFCCLLAVSATAFSQQKKLDEKVSLQVTQGSLGSILDALDRQSSLSFTYIKEDFDNIPVTNYKADSLSLQEALNRLKKKAGFEFTVNGNLLLFRKAVPEPAPRNDPGRVTGKVVDEETGEPLAGVTVIIGGKGMTSDIDGAFSIALPEGKYTAEISSVGYGAKQVTDIEIKDNQTFELNVTLKKEKNTLESVVVKVSVKQETIAALYARQKNTAEISNGISSEQFSATPDKNVGEVLKRISGVSTNDNRRVVVRGIAERYNVAMMDGIMLPSTDVQVRDFEFDIIPSNLVENVIVSKGYTPDMSFGFGGGLVQINTLTIPSQNFNSISVGGKYNTISTGKDFLGYQRGKSDYLGFDDGGRKNHFPNDIFNYDLNRYNPSKPYENVVPAGSDLTPITVDMIAEQNKKIGGTERLGTRIYTARPSQNYQVSLGRSYNVSGGRIGFVGSLSYRNEQSIGDILHFERGDWTKNGYNYYDEETGEEIHNTTGKQYDFSTTWAALLNAGWETKNHKLYVRNFYSRVYQDQFTRIQGWGNDLGYDEDPAIIESDRPKFIDLLQNKISGVHKFGQISVDWNLAQNKVSNYEYDAVEAMLKPVEGFNTKVYTYIVGGVTNPGTGPLNRAQYKYDENNLSGDVAFSYQFKLGHLHQKVKAGYQYLKRHGKYDWVILPIGTLNAFSNRYLGMPIHEWTPYFDFNDAYTDLYYYPAAFSLSGYEGENVNQAFFGMLDNRITNWMRVVWGLRIESYEYEQMKNSVSDHSANITQQSEALRRYVDPATGELVHKYLDATTEETKWRYLPSVNITFTPLPDFNIRTSYAESVVRPALIENSNFSRYNPTLGRIQRNTGVLSTTIKHYDARMEWYPSSGEVISLGYFYKHFDHPVELYLDVVNSSQKIDAITGNSDWAKVHGWELDLRKNLGFIYPSWKPLGNLFLSGNLTVQSSEVQASTFSYINFGQGSYDKDGYSYSYREKILLKEKRPLYGQVPIVYNIGLLYNADRLSLNAVFNHMGYKTLTVGTLPSYVEYERPRNQLDAQIAYKFLENKALGVKLNISNILNNPQRFFLNSQTTYKPKDKPSAVFHEWADQYEWVYGFSNKYEEGYYKSQGDGKTMRIGDTDTFIRKLGTSFSFAVSYSF